MTSRYFTTAGLDALSLTMVPRELGLVRRMATLIGAAFVACALVYLVTRLVASGF